MPRARRQLSIDVGNTTQHIAIEVQQRRRHQSHLCALYGGAPAINALLGGVTAVLRFLELGQ
jgi:hypothetical protein